MLVEGSRSWTGTAIFLPLRARIWDWGVIAVVPLFFTIFRRRESLIPVISAIAFVIILPWCAHITTQNDGVGHTYTSNDPNLAAHALAAIFAIFLSAWGVRMASRALVNLGIAGFALSVVWFYFSDIFDKVGRSIGLIGLGILFLAGGWLLEKTRRRLIAGMTESSFHPPGGRMSLARTSMALLAIQLGLVSSIAAKYLLDRSISPRVWTRAVAYDPTMIMRGRYLSTQLKIDACGINLPVTKTDVNVPPDGHTYFDPDGNGTVTGHLPVLAGIKNGHLAVLRIAKSHEEANSQAIILRKWADCTDAVLWTPVDFLPLRNRQSPFPLRNGQELWVEVTVPSSGPPRPIGLATKSANGQWQPLNYQ